MQPWPVPAALWCGIIALAAIDTGSLARMVGIAADPMLWVGCALCAWLLRPWWAALAGAALVALCLHLLVDFLNRDFGYRMPLTALVLRAYAAVLLTATMGVLRQVVRGSR